MATYKLNRRAVEAAKSMIEARRYVLRSDWGLRQPRAEQENKYLASHSWEDYGAWHLGLTDGAPDDTKGRYAFVFGDLRRIHRSGLVASYYRAAEWGHREIYVAAHRLLLLLDERAGFSARAGAGRRRGPARERSASG